MGSIVDRPQLTALPTCVACGSRVSSVIDRKWLYRPVDEIRRILDERAACDLTTGRPIVYLSQDPHAERRFVDETWTAGTRRCWMSVQATAPTLWWQPHEVPT